jgi:hypothetical protein
VHACNLDPLLPLRSTRQPSAGGTGTGPLAGSMTTTPPTPGSLPSNPARPACSPHGLWWSSGLGQTQELRSNKVCALHSTENSAWSLLYNPGDLEAAEQPQHLTNRTVEAGSKLIGMNRILAKEPRQLPLLGRERLR